MGAWGYEALANDTALDYAGTVGDDLAALIRNTFARSDYPEEVRAAAHIMVTTTPLFFAWSRDDYETAINLIQGYHDDEDYVRDWDDSTAIRSALQADIAALKEAMADPPTTTLFAQIEKGLAEGKTLPGNVNR